MNCSAGRKKLCMQSGSNGRSGLGLDRGLAPQKLTFLWQLYMGGRSGEGGRKDGRFWQKTRTKKAECLTSTNSAPQALILDRGRLWSPDPSPQHCPESAGASRALESLYHATGNDRRNLAQIKAILQWTILSYTWRCGSVQGNKHSSSSARAISTGGNHSQSQTVHSWAAQMSHAWLQTAEQPRSPSQV